MLDNRARGIACYHPGYTLVEKLQTLATKYRQQQETGAFPANFMRHYYDVYCLLQEADVLSFIGTAQYQAHKQRRFRAADNPIIAENEAFLLRNEATRQVYEEAYQATRTLYYKTQPGFSEIMSRIWEYREKL